MTQLIQLPVVISEAFLPRSTQLAKQVVSSDYYRNLVQNPHLIPPIWVYLVEPRVYIINQSLLVLGLYEQGMLTIMGNIISESEMLAKFFLTSRILERTYIPVIELL